MSSTKSKTRDTYLQKTYGISLTDYNRILKAQSESCAICLKHQSKFSRSLAVDHNHKSKKVRGLLCFYCNKFIVGRHNLETATKLFNYMKKYETK